METLAAHSRLSTVASLGCIQGSEPQDFVALPPFCLSLHHEHPIVYNLEDEEHFILSWYDCFPFKSTINPVYWRQFILRRGSKHGGSHYSLGYHRQRPSTSKARDVYHSADGVTAENADLEALTIDIVAATTKLTASSSHVSGNDNLDDICRRCTASANDLVVVLQKLKVDGQQGKWKSVRKGLKAVWGKKVDELRGMLVGWRDEIQFHVVVQMRYGLCAAVGAGK
ncbi:hypothetical protein BKA65DRAFT_268917 [Rhexocercosporidium sp. MPI-PUGE-AT-0058]|nr:hypothetical protein BKA65DRAFT_268917 [Rhexocercosporidium sp. MPI-PUGE-AT-0058]